MKNETMMRLYRFPVLVVKTDNHEAYAKYITLTQEEAECAEQSNLLEWLCEMNGYRLAEVGKAEQKTVCIDLDALWKEGGGNG